MSGISRHPADFFQTADFSSVVFNTFLVCNCLEGIQSTLFQANCATLAGQQKLRNSLERWGIGCPRRLHTKKVLKKHTTEICCLEKDS